MNSELHSVTRKGSIPRTESTVFNLEDPQQRQLFIKGQAVLVQVPGSARRVPYDPQKRIGVAISKLGTARAVSLGAYALALSHLQQP